MMDKEIWWSHRVLVLYGLKFGDIPPFKMWWSRMQGEPAQSSKVNGRYASRQLRGVLVASTVG